jgi:hypothetical protein
LPKEEQSFYERTRTLVVNAHGALISLAADVVLDQTLVLQNALTGEERECRIVFTDRNRIGPIEVGLVRRPPFPTRYVVSLRTGRMASPFFTIDGPRVDAGLPEGQIVEMNRLASLHLMGSMRAVARQE